MVVENVQAMKYLEECIEDDNRIITYKGLSRHLGLHVNTAKQLLYKFLEDYRCRNSSSKVHASYLLTGVDRTINGTEVNRIVVVSDENLEKEKKKMSRVAGIHVYSIQKCCLKDCNPLYATDLWKTGDDPLLIQRFSGISFDKASMATTRCFRAEPSPSSPQASKIKKPLLEAKPAVPMPVDLGKLTPKTIPTPPGTEKPKHSVKSKPKETKKKVGGHKQSNVLSLWNRKASAPNLKVPDESQSTGNDTQSSEALDTESEGMKARLSSSEDDASDEEPIPTKVKRQKRILIQQSSESEDEDACAVKNTEEFGQKSDSAFEADSEEPIPPTPVEKRRKKAVRTVAKVYADEDGFMVTQKVKENVSEPEDESENQQDMPPKPAVPSTPKAVPVKNAPKKQASLTSFFGKRT